MDRLPLTRATNNHMELKHALAHPDYNLLELQIQSKLTHIWHVGRKFKFKFKPKS